MKVVIISLCIGLLGGVLGALFLITFFTLPSVTSVPSVLPITPARRATSIEFQTAQALESIVPFIKPSPGDTFSSFTKATGAGIALTADGLLISTVSVKNISGVKGVPLEGLPFTLAPAQGKDGKPVVLGSVGLTLLKAAAAEPSPRLKPITFSGFEDLAIGQPVFSVDAARNIAWHHIAALSAADFPEKPLSSEDPQGGFFMVDAVPQEGAFLFNAQGQLIGIAKTQGEIIPAEWIASAVRQYLQGGAYRPTTLGIYLIDLHRLIALVPSLPDTGLRIEGDRTHRAIVPGSPASVAGLRSEDIITVFDGRRLDGTVPFALLLQRYSPGTEIEIEFIRNGKVEKAKVVLGELSTITR